VIQRMSLIQQTKRFLYVYGVYPKKRLGQNFMTDSALLQRMIAYAALNNEDVVLEVGAGLGFLTRLLSKKCKKVVAVEVDPKLIQALREQFQNIKNVELIEGDVLKASISAFNKVVATPPYSISSPLLFWLLERPFDVAVLTFQKELAERLAASVGSKDYSRLTVTTYYRADVELLDYVPRTAFYPPPDVDSLIVRLKPKLKPPFRVNDEQAFYELVQTVFTQRNKKLRNAILPFFQKRGIAKEKAQKMADSLTFHDKRVRELVPEDFGVLTNEVLEKTSILR
jgi:16S rRNA (adenine1518-N6/adenine1519-N6)-dimethyltransferase